MKQVELLGIHVEATTGAPLVMLREQDEPHRLLPIFIGASEAASIAMGATGETPPRPMSHDLMLDLVQRLDGRIDGVEVTELRDGTFIADLTVHGPNGQHRIDTRPSDAIALAVRVGAPLFVSEAVLDEAGSVPQREEVDEASIAEAVSEFRSFLEEVDPTEFEDPDV